MGLAISAAAATWTLLVVMGNGDIHHDDSFRDKHACLEAESMALHGMTIEEKEAADQKAANAREVRDKAWRDAHPPYKAVTQEDLAMVKTAQEEIAKYGHPISGVLGSSLPYKTVGDDGLIYDWPANITEGTSWNTDPTQDIKYTKCFPNS
jgi:hypothetical protein